MGLRLSPQTTVFIDTAPFIYFFEEHALYGQAVDRFFRSLEEHAARLLTSLVTYMEILTRPYAAGDTQLADKYRAFFTNSENLVLVPLSPAVAEEAARLRARHGLRTPDAIQLASARCYGADHVLTNDLSWKAIPGYSILTMEELGQEGA